LRLIVVPTFVAIVVAGLAAGCSRVEPEPHPLSVVLITVDTLRSDRLGVYGYAAAKTPAIDELASEGALFEDVYCDIPWTTASMASMMTGLFSTEHGLQAPWLRLPDDQLTIAEVFQSEGYQTGAVVGIFSLDAVYGLDQGFDSYDDDFSLPAVILPDAAPMEHIELEISDGPQEFVRRTEAKLHNDAYKDDAEVTDNALEWLNENIGGPFFLWAHYFGPHERLVFSKDAYDNKTRMIREYDGDLARTDVAIGRLLKGLDDLDLRSNTLVVLSSDHGQTLGERNTVGHGRDLYEPEVRIPLLVRLPSRVEAGIRLPQVVRSIDIFPTILDYAGIDPPDHVTGLSVRNLIDGEEQQERLAFMDLNVIMPTLLDDDDGNHFFGGAHFQALRKGNWKLVTAELAPGCWEGGGEVEWTFLGIDPKGRKGAVRLPDERCSDHGFARLFDVTQSGPRLARENQDETSRQVALKHSMDAMLAKIASRKGEAESFELSPEQKRKLKSLGYLQDE